MNSPSKDKQHFKQDSLGFLLGSVARLIRSAFQKRVEHCAITFAQAKALIYVARNEGVRQVHLAELLELQPMSMARLIDQLQEAGFVERRPDPDDRRAYRIFLKAEAESQLEAIAKETCGLREIALEGVKKQDAATAERVLKQMQDNLLEWLQKP